MTKKRPRKKPDMVREPVSLYDAKTHLSELVERAAQGEEITIAKSGKPKARLVPLTPEDTRHLRVPGKGKGQGCVAPGFDAPLPPEVLRLFWNRARVRLIFDTNALIRWHRDELRSEAVVAVRQADLVAVSAVSAWEIGIKHSLRKLDIPATVEDMLRLYGFEALDVTVRHGDLARSLPWYHYDPFDRLLIVQALDEGLTILTADRAFEPYRVPVVWV
jgi:prevent-host-death family protein